MFEKLMRLKFVQNKKHLVYVFIALFFLITLIPFTFVLKLFLLLASATLGVSLWVKWDTFFPKKKRMLGKRHVSKRIRKNTKDSRNH